MEAKKAYQEIFRLLKRHKDTCIFDLDDLETRANIHLFGLSLKEKWGLDVDPRRIDSTEWVRLGDHRSVGWWGEKHNRTISWSVDGRQPNDELLLQISFPTGAYIFGEDYPTAFFREFWEELKSFNPGYVDERNNSLYWRIENAAGVFNSFDALMKKYREKNAQDFKKRKIEKMKEEIEKLERNSG